MYTATINKTYSYKCVYCYAKFDISLTDMSDSEDIHNSGGVTLEFCPLCGSCALVRDYKEENKSVIFKGKGFYSTDNREREND